MHDGDDGNTGNGGGSGDDDDIDMTSEKTTMTVVRAAARARYWKWGREPPTTTNRRGPAAPARVRAEPVMVCPAMARRIC